MGRLARISKAILHELNFKHPKAVEIPAISNDELLKGHLALVTGGSSGIGLEIARRFAQSGCEVVISGTNEKKLEAAIEAIGSDHVSSCQLDVTDSASIECGIAAVLSMFPEARGIDILVNSAGVASSGKFGSVTEAAYDKVLDTNLKGTFFMCQAVSNHMIERRGHILNISSSSALRNAKTPYEISKWGVKGLTLGFADELIKEGIIVNAIAPGPTATPLLGKEDDGVLTHIANPSRRLAHPAEIANLALVLVSSAGDLVVGDTLYATGGAGTICIDR